MSESMGDAHGYMAFIPDKFPSSGSNSMNRMKSPLVRRNPLEIWDATAFLAIDTVKLVLYS